MLAVVDLELTVRGGPGRATQTRARLEQRDARAGVAARDGGLQTGETAAHDDDVRRAHDPVRKLRHRIRRRGAHVATPRARRTAARVEAARASASAAANPPAA